MKALFATGPKGEFGTASGLPWEHSKEDLARFKAITLGKIVLVGMKTFEMLPELKGRTFFVITSNPILQGKHVSARNCGLCMSLEHATLRYPNAIIIGGAQLLKSAWPFVHQFMWSYMHHVGPPEDTTIFFKPDISGFTEIYSEKRTDHLFSIYRRV